MKVGIVTFHSSLNYGAILQAYALQEALNGLGAEASMVNYHCEYSEKQLKPFDIKRIKSPQSLVKEVLRFPVRKKKFKQVNKFNDKYIRLGQRECFNEEDLAKVNDDYDYFITGSDQVWNYEMRDFDKAYFLDFVTDSKKKNSYAASFGISEIPDKLKEEYKGLLKDFNNISVREVQGQKIVKDLLGRESNLNIDPSLLLNKAQWEKVGNCPHKGKPYILVYSLVKTESMFNFVKDLSEKTGCEIVVIGSYLKTRVKAKYYNTPSPDEFVGLFANAEYIVTNSFHGIAFSINLNKSFFAELQPPPAKRNSRLESLLDLVGLRDRLIQNGKHENINEVIDYDLVNEKLDEERQKSFNYLKGIIGE